ncbi:MAG TPA: HlyD family secretion protein [Opitutaceae bacterium]|nr:HlyD family secretion protein [Opitutaceae bacterium]
MSTLVETAPAAPAYAGLTPARPAAPARTAKTARRWPGRKLLLGAGASLLAAAGISLYVYRAAGVESTDDAYLEGHVHPISARINGTVARVLVDDNVRVQAGQPLVELDPADLDLAAQEAAAGLAQARANGEQAAAQVARAEADVTAAAARITQNAAELKRAQLDLKRSEFLAGTDAGAIPVQQLDAARAAFESAQAAEQSLQAQHRAAQAALTAARAQQAVAAAQLARAAAGLDNARLQTGYTVIRSPVAGRVAKKSVEAGQRLQPGQPLLAVVDDDVWIVANFKESQLAHLRPGQKVTVRVDAIDGRAFTGVVQSFSPGTGARFALLPPDNSTGNFNKVVQRVPVKLLFTPDSVGADADRLFPGLSAVVAVDVRHGPAGPLAALPAATR